MVAVVIAGVAVGLSASAALGSRSVTTPLTCPVAGFNPDNLKADDLVCFWESESAMNLNLSQTPGPILGTPFATAARARQDQCFAGIGNPYASTNVQGVGS